jgi:branched-chain amino acid transport system substrate-binding protein
MPDQFAAQGFDGMNLAAEALKSCQKIDRDSVRDALTQVKFTGVMGPFTFDANREPGNTEGVLTFEVSNGAFKIVQ